MKHLLYKIIVIYSSNKEIIPWKIIICKILTQIFPFISLPCAESSTTAEIIAIEDRDIFFIIIILSIY